MDLTKEDFRLIARERAEEVAKLRERCDAYKGQVEAGEAEIERLRNGIAQICDGLERGDIGEDVTWFNDFETLWEHCADLIGRTEPLGDNLPLPTSADREYLVQRLRTLTSDQGES